MRIFMGTDYKYSIPTLFSLWQFSRKAQSTHQYNLAIFEGSLSSGLGVMLTEAISGLNLQAKIVELPVRTTYREMQHLSKSTYLRLAIQEVDVGGFLWLDSDLLPNWNWDIPFLPIPTEGRIAAVSETSMGRTCSGQYFNAGVSVFPPGQEDYSSSFERLISGEVGPWLWGDQDVLNDHFSRRFDVLDPRLNVDASGSAEIKDYRILHYLGTYKPWHLPKHLEDLCIESSCYWGLWHKDFREFLTIARKVPALNGELDSFLKANSHFVKSERLRIRLLWSRMAHFPLVRILGQVVLKSRGFYLHPYHW